MKQQKLCDLNIRSSYKLYRQIGIYKPVPREMYVKIVNAYLKFLFKKVLEGFKVTFPAKLGTLSVVGRKVKIKYDANGEPNLSPNWKKTLALWKRDPKAKEEKKKIYNLNEHSQGVFYKAFWSKEKVYVENKENYSLILTRDNKRAISAQALAGKEYYIKFND
jgi:tRNA nucleotidyltransferase/poly(A) polymerase